MNAAEKLMAIKGLIAGLQAAEAAQKEGILDLKQQVGASSFKTALGGVSVATPKPKITVTDEAGLLAWVEDNFPSEVETIRRVRPRSREVLVGHLMMVGSDVVTAEGEVVTWATVDQGEEYVTARLAGEVKAAAVEQVGAALDSLLNVLEIGSGS